MKIIRTVTPWIAMLMAAPAFGAEPQPTDRIKLDISRAELTAVAQGLMKLPYEQAAPILNDLSAQVNAQDKKPEAAPVVPTPADPAGVPK